MAALLSLLFFWRAEIQNGFTILFGDSYDAMIEVAILQHWENVFSGYETWNRTAYFFPAADTLGYNDGYFLYGAIYAGLRHLGLSLIAAADAVHAIVKVLGFFGMFMLLRLVGECRFGWSVFGSVLFTIADITMQHANHGQLFTIAFAPWCFIATKQLIDALRLNDRQELFKSGLIFSGLYALWVSTAFYLAWFFGFYVAILAAVITIQMTPEQRQACFLQIKSQRIPLIVIVSIQVALLTPFLIVYLPKSVETGMHSFTIVGGSAFWPLDYVNQGSTNVLWSHPFSALRALIDHGLKTNHDEIFGIAPILFALTIFGFWKLIPSNKQFMTRAVAISVLFCWGLMFRGVWIVVYLLIPGAKGIRSVGRFNILLLVPVIFIVTIILDHVKSKIWAIGLATLLLAEEVDAKSPTKLDRNSEMAMITGASQVVLSSGCNSFYVISSRVGGYPIVDPSNDHVYAHNVDAMIISEVTKTYTINGFSTFLPPHWDFDYPESPDYKQRVIRYARITNIPQLCGLRR